MLLFLFLTQAVVETIHASFTLESVKRHAIHKVLNIRSMKPAL